MACYEHIFIARPDISEAQVKTFIEDYSKIIKDNGGKVTKDEYWGLRTLAYKIRKSRKAHYVLLNVDGPHDAIQAVEDKQRYEDDILRYMTIRVDELEDGPSAVLRAKSSGDDDRDRRGGRR